MADPLKPSMTLLVKLGSALVHAEEYLDVDGHAFDKDAFLNIASDPEVKEWREAMDGMALLPVRRDDEPI